MAKNVSQKSETKWYDNSIVKISTIVAKLIFIASLGYGFAIIQKNVEFKLERTELRQDYNEKLQEQSAKCEQEKQKIENDRVEALERAVRELQNSRHDEIK